MLTPSLLSRIGVPRYAVLRIFAVGLLTLVVALASGRLSVAIDPGDALTWWLYFVLVYAGAECLILAIRKAQQTARRRSR